MKYSGKWHWLEGLKTNPQIMFRTKTERLLKPLRRFNLCVSFRMYEELPSCKGDRLALEAVGDVKVGGSVGETIKYSDDH